MRDLLAEMDATNETTPALWWLGHAGFVVKHQGIVFYVDPCLANPPGRTRTVARPLAPSR